MSKEEVKEITHRFVCPECAEDLEVNDSMKEALIDNGCVICGASVSEEAFSSSSTT